MFEPRMTHHPTTLRGFVRKLPVGICQLAMVVFMSLPTSLWSAETKVSLWTTKTAVAPGGTATAAIVFELKEGWHTYWRNGGDAAQPPSLAWDLPPGVETGPIQWPLPEKEVVSGLTSYSYHEEVLLLVPLQFDASLKPGQVNLQCQVNWLECQETCVPRQAKVLGTIEISLEEKASDEAPLIQRSADLVPETDNALPLRADWSKTLAEDERILTLELDPQSGFRWLDFYPHENDSFELGGASTLLPNRTEAIRLEKNVLNWEDSWPAQISGVALLIDADEKPWTRETTIVLGGSFPQTEKTTDSTQAATLPSNKTPQRPSMLLMLGFALLGGMILNLMPCVLPVISLKILGFVEQGAEDRKKVFQMGLLYGLGVLVSFWALASIVIAIQSTGQSANWGMQFQNPQFLLLMTILLTLIALNFFGVFEITGGSLTGVASRLGGGHGRGGAFANGVLATILATPCTAPFLGTALGFAFTQPPTGILLMFTTIGVGLALPYVALSWNPGWLQILPRPGAWMTRFKVFMGFPMLGTVVWLYSIARLHFGPGGDLWLGLCLVSIALLAWIYGECIQKARGRKGWAWGALLAGILVTYGWILEHELNWRQPALKDGENTPSDATLISGKNGIQWMAWSEAAVIQAQQKGQVVLVDFTAKWCPNCQVNKKTSIEIPSVKEKLESIGGLTMRGDYTFQDRRITQKLKEHGRIGVPLVLVYPPSEGAEPIVLPELLTPSIVLKALDEASGSAMVPIDG